MQPSKNTGHGHHEEGSLCYTSGEYSYSSRPMNAEGARSHPNTESCDCDDVRYQFGEYDPIWARSRSVSPRDGSRSRENTALQGRSAQGSVPLSQPSTVVVDREIHHLYQHSEPHDALPEAATASERQQVPHASLPRIRLFWAASAVVLVLSLLAYALFMNEYAADSNLITPSFVSGKPLTGTAAAKAFSGDKRVKDSRLPWQVTDSSSPSMVISAGVVKSSENQGIATRQTPLSDVSSEVESTKDGTVVKGVSGPGLPLRTDQRSEPSEGIRPKSSRVTPGADEPHGATSLAIISRQLQLVDVQRQSYELALELMHARPGAFSGFFPERTTPVASYVKSFEGRIVDLEMQKKALGLRFKPQSREIQLINQEIIGIRDAMKEYIGEQLVFLQKRRETLHAQKTRLERKLGKSGPIKDLSKLNWLPDEWPLDARHDPAHSTLDDGDLPGGKTCGESDDVGSTVVSGVKRLVALGKETLGSFPFSSSLDVEPSRE